MKIDAVYVLEQIDKIQVNTDLVAAICRSLQERDQDEAVDLAKLHMNETSRVHADAFKSLLNNDGVRHTAVDFMWTLSYYEESKRPALAAIGEMRGTFENIGTGFPCDKCGNCHTVARPVQTSAGDEGTKLQVECLVPSCRHVQVMG